MSDELLSGEEITRLYAVAEQLIPGQPPSPAAVELPDYTALLQRGAEAVGRELGDLRETIGLLPESIDFEGLRRYAEAEPLRFDLLSAVVSGAYFMSTQVLESIGYPTGARAAAPFDLAADELSSGILEPVLARGPRVRMPS